MNLIIIVPIIGIVAMFLIVIGIYVLPIIGWIVHCYLEDKAKILELKLKLKQLEKEGE